MEAPNPIPDRGSSTRQLLSAEDIERILRGRPGLLVGPSLSMGAGRLSYIAREIAEENGILGEESNLLTQVDRLIATGNENVASRVKEKLRDKFQEARTGTNRIIERTAKTRWSAVLSACWDSDFEKSFQNWCEASPTRPKVTVISDYSQAVPPRTTPVYKLMGSIHHDDFVICSNDYRLRTVQWHRVLRDFAATVKGNGVLCLGMEDSAYVLLDLLAIMLSDPGTQPGPLFFLQDDPILKDPEVVDLAKRGVHVHPIALTIEGFLTCLENSVKSGYTSKLPFEINEKSQAEQLEAFHDLVITVNEHKESKIAADEKHILHDLLFSPGTSRWEPFVHGLDFPRTISENILAYIQNSLTTKGRQSLIIKIAGASATGKTTLMKRVALNLATPETLVLWSRPYFYQDGTKQLRSLANCIASSEQQNNRRIVVFVDDPYSLGAVSVDDIKTAFDSACLNAVFVVGLRTADSVGQDSDVFQNLFDKIHEFEISGEFDEEEWGFLPQYLVKLGVCEKLKDGENLVSKAVNRGCRDILSMLFWMLPETRSHITKSVRNEHLRLGDRAAFSKVLIGELTHTSELLTNAYELVAVAIKYETPVPVELLVSALGVSYREWLDAGGTNETGGLKWGLLYEEASPSTDALVYRTRNHIVTDIVVETINGGKFGHSGEVSRLRTLLSACNGSSPVYREFCVRILVPNDRPQLSHLEFPEGLDLYHDAIEAIPFDDRTLVHHMGLWEKNRGHKPLQARETLLEAARTKLYPFATRSESIEHIYTSLAATEIDAIKQRDVSLEEGKKRVFDALERARPEQFQNPYVVHVQADLFVKLADLTSKPSDPDFIRLMQVALADVDRMLLFLKSDFENRADSRQQVQMLEDVSSRVLDRVASLDELVELADKMWLDHKRQDGFVLVGRKLYNEARKSNKGSQFNKAYEFCIKTTQKIEYDRTEVSYQLSEVMLHIYFHWRVRRPSKYQSTDEIDWKTIERLANMIISDQRSKSDPLHSYLVGLAKSHLGDWGGASIMFDDLRRRSLPPNVLYRARDYLVGKTGQMLRVQGTIRKGAGRDFFCAEALNTDFLLGKNSKWADEGQIEHAYIRFSFAGPIASKEP